MTKLVAQCEVYYGSKTNHAGDTFEASDQDARILVGLGKARLNDVPAQPLQTQALQAENPPAEKPPAEPMTTAAQPALSPKRRNYKRRDMRAED